MIRFLTVLMLAIFYDLVLVYWANIPLFSKEWWVVFWAGSVYWGGVFLVFSIGKGEA